MRDRDDAAPKGPGDDDPRAEGKRIADRLREHYAESGEPLGWFDACYREAAGDAWLVPWGHLEPRPELVQWVERQGPDERRGRLLDVGCGLGDNAALLAQAGFDVTAFDLSQTAVDWARRRFASLPITWAVGDLTDPPEAWAASFDVVSEVYTLQALREPYRSRAFKALAGLVKPGGRLLIVARGRHTDEPEDPPPWPILREELDALAGHGLSEVGFEDFLVERDGKPMRHFRAEYRRGT